MKELTPEQLKDILAKHEKWLRDEKGGQMADFSNANLSFADLRHANLRDANFRNANLSGANLRYAILRNANLINANLNRALLNGADLSCACLHRADLIGAILDEAVLRCAYLVDANLNNVDMNFNTFFGGANGAPIYQACCGFGDRNAALTLFAQGKPKEWLFFTGCFKGTRSELMAAVREKHGGTAEEANYKRAIQYLWKTAKANAVNE